METPVEPLIWVLQGTRAGDNAQARELAARIGGNIELKALSFTFLHYLPNLVLGPSRMSISDFAAAALTPPWPDLVIATGKRTAPVSRWIKAQSRGTTRIVQIGRPRAPLAGFDLVVTTPQYGLPAAENVIEIPLPFATPRRTGANDIAYWSKAWSHLPHPWIAVLVGASKFPLRLGDAEINRLAADAAAVARMNSGSLLVFGSPRTPPGLVKRMRARLTVPAEIYPWNANELAYPCALSLAERFIVTSDSISMMAEAISSGRPVDIFVLPSSQFAPRWNAKHGVAGWLSRHGLLQPPRDVSKLVGAYIDLGLASPLGRNHIPVATINTGHDIVLARIEAILRRS